MKSKGFAGFKWCTNYSGLSCPSQGKWPRAIPDPGISILQNVTAWFSLGPLLTTAATKANAQAAPKQEKLIKPRLNFRKTSNKKTRQKYHFLVKT